MKRFYRWALVSTWLACTPLAALAQPAPNVFAGGNHWNITFYDDRSPAHTQWATQGICFFPFAAAGTHVSGMWYSTTFPDWNGRYTQEGDQVKMHGDYALNVGHDGMTWEITTAKTGAGEWKEWRENPGVGTTIGWGNANWTRVGACPSPTAVTTAAALSDDDLEKELLRLSQQVPPRCLSDGVTPAEDPLDRRQRACR